MKINKFLTAGLITLTAIGTAFAQNPDDFSFSNDSFDFEGDTASSTLTPVEISGQVDANVRYYNSTENTNSIDETPVEGDANVNLNARYSGAKADAEIKLNLNSKTLKEHPEDIIDEAYITTYLGNFKLEAGKMKIVWGKGDKLHVIDNFNADDYSDFIIPDYLDRRIATPMLRATYNFDYSGNVLSNIKLEGVYTPFLPADRFATKGRWIPQQVNNLTNTVTIDAAAYLKEAVTELENARLLASEVNTLNDLYASGDESASQVLMAKINKARTDGLISADEEQINAYMEAYSASVQVATQAVLAKEYKEYVQNNLETADTKYTYALNNASVLSADSSTVYPELNSLKYGQVGARLTYSLGQFDLGASYYYGHYKQLSVNASKINTYLAEYLSNKEISEEDNFLTYDQKQTFGIEAATIIWHFNVRGEAAYNLTKDTDGTDPWVHNNSIQWLGGFDIDVPLWNMNINVQETGTYILQNNKISGSPTELLDVDYNANGYTNNKIVANITTSFLNDKVLPEITVMYGIENADVVIMPKLVVKPAGEVSLTACGMYIWNKNDNSEFASWKDNNFIQFGAIINF